MPNMFGGDQFHPAYSPQSKLSKNQVMVGNTVYSLPEDEEQGYVEGEDVDGQYFRQSLSLAPDKVKEFAKSFYKQQK